VDFGSAITIDLVEGGVFRGGNISPGMRMRFQALHNYTKRLPECQPTEEILELGTSTVSAIEQGVMQGIVNEIEGYISYFYARNVKLSLIFTGGDAKFFVKRIKNAIFAKCDLVICGLNRILEYNARRE
jgi:type III pantothenate kinase